MTIREQTTSLLIATFGPPTSETKYVLRWHLADNLDVVQEKRYKLGKLWTEWPGSDNAQLYFGLHRPPEDRVNSNVYSKSASLRAGNLLELRIETKEELEKSIAWLRARRDRVSPPNYIAPSNEDDSENTTIADSNTSKSNYKRIRIPKSVRFDVWRRDQGKCTSCHSRHRLEYDHIIPVSKGGSNTERNIELLCEKCNRRKGARIEG